MESAKCRGSRGEEFAVQQLLKTGYEILQRNWRSGHSEIDIIAQKENTIAFIEVKLRGETAFAQPAAFVSRAQRRRIILAAVAYLQERGIYNTGRFQPRFDIFEIVTQEETPDKVLRWEHLPGAYDTEGLDVFI